MTYIVALTGGIGSGKTTVSNCFKKIGVNIIDTDVIAKNIVERNLKVVYSIKKKIGKKVLNVNNSINRYLLRKHILNNKNDRLWLENLLHPKIYQETKNQIYNIKSHWCLWVVPLLIEKNLEKQANRILLVDAPVKKQITRIIKRDNINILEAKKIIALQTTRKKRISISDDIIFNNYNYRKIQLYVNYLNLFYLYLSKQHQKKNIIKKNYLTKFY
ncbi:dephospho-CoA kinase [Buchnera aphidicola (Macrosiphoniella sanborni)]|uniref:Dephospho-CoA kinase n=1 Tax=Buchnera aphidicola (Macrosiphoniella sanborni) TaxID=1241865 RepID=A0A4D6Y581_9GAMM|nr:dephospho-CoA kinase [Buchnera aphidicola]QCI23753.1 dephospho-CoA kinase [Buchnera aphidicola (Macrosiphoniella sanborni)]